MSDTLGVIGTVLSGIGRTAFRLAYQLSPIVLQNGVAGSIPGGVLPLVTITEAANLVAGLLSGGPVSPDDFFAHFEPAPGLELVRYDLGRYPFANQAVAANAVIRDPLRFSMLMKCPVRGGGYAAKIATFTAMKQVIDQHVELGGTFIVATPSIIKDNAILLNITEVGASQDKQPQIVWQWDFEQPLLTLAQAQAAQNSQMSKLTAGGQTDGSTSSLASTVGSTGSGATSGSYLDAGSGPASGAATFSPTTALA